MTTNSLKRRNINIASSPSSKVPPKIACKGETYNSYTVVNSDYVIFKDELSQLSNFYEKPFYDNDGRRFLTLEHYFQYQKAVFFNDGYKANKILNTPKALMVKRISKRIRNYDNNKWITVRDNNMYQGLTLKFKDQELKEFLKNCYFNRNKRCQFIENSGHNYWGCNVKNPFNYNNYNEITGLNKLGILMNRLAKRLFDQ
uniref:DUF1768 domain-containing protein n=1 Tax=Strongyloides venezuelensis TaxID=75913 RepID=A0A0K0FWC8_STRVS